MSCYGKAFSASQKIRKPTNIDRWDSTMQQPVYNTAFSTSLPAAMQDAIDC